MLSERSKHMVLMEHGNIPSVPLLGLWGLPLGTHTPEQAVFHKYLGALQIGTLRTRWYVKFPPSFAEIKKHLSK